MTPPRDSRSELDDGPDRERSASTTALGVATLRAAHLLIDDPPPILADTVAARLLGPDAEARILAHRDAFERPGSRALRSHVVLRSRHAEDVLAQALGRGVRQHVMLGAGLDTFAYRQPAWATRLRVFEVDHPASQAVKRERLEAAGIAPPGNVTFVAVDLELDPLDWGLGAAAFDSRAPAFVAALGLLPYLRPETVDGLFRFAASLAPGSQLVATFAQPPIPGFDRLALGAAAAGEPWLSRHEPAVLRRRLLELGFGDVAFLEPEDAARRYYAGRTDGLPPPRRINTVIATR